MQNKLFSAQQIIHISQWAFIKYVIIGFIIECVDDGRVS